METEPSLALPDVPRDLTRRIRRRAWAEPRVFFWVILTGALLAVDLLFGVQAVRARLHDAWLIENGVPVVARVTLADGEPVKGKHKPPGSLVEIEFMWEQNPKFSPGARALDGRKEPIVVGSFLSIRVNPNNPRDWTTLDEPLPIFQRMVGALVIFPIALLALGWTIRMQWLIQYIWRQGKAIDALIVDSRHTAISPSSRVARATPAAEGDSRIYTIYLPPHLAALKRGDTVTILRPANSATACAAAWFQ